MRLFDDMNDLFFAALHPNLYLFCLNCFPLFLFLVLYCFYVVFGFFSINILLPEV